MVKSIFNRKMFYNVIFFCNNFAQYNYYSYFCIDFRESVVIQRVISRIDALAYYSHLTEKTSEIL